MLVVSWYNFDEVVRHACMLACMYYAHILCSFEAMCKTYIAVARAMLTNVDDAYNILVN